MPRNSTLKKSASASPQYKPRLSRTFKRKTSFRVAEPEDLKWLWGAYRKGGVDLPEGLTPQDFREKAADMLAGFDEAYLLEIDRPVGVVGVGFTDGERVFQPRALWFPWASSRDKLTATLRFLREMGKERVGMIFSEPEDKSFLEHVCRYGVLRRVGKVYDMGPKEMVLFQTRKMQ